MNVKHETPSHLPAGICLDGCKLDADVNCAFWHFHVSVGSSRCLALATGVFLGRGHHSCGCSCSRFGLTTVGAESFEIKLCISCQHLSEVSASLAGPSSEAPKVFSASCLGSSLSSRGKGQCHEHAKAGDVAAILTSKMLRRSTCWLGPYPFCHASGAESGNPSNIRHETCPTQVRHRRFLDLSG